MFGAERIFQPALLGTYLRYLKLRRRLCGYAKPEQYNRIFELRIKLR